MSPVDQASLFCLAFSIIPAERTDFSHGKAAENKDKAVKI